MEYPSTILAYTHRAILAFLFLFLCFVPLSLSLSNLFMGLALGVFFLSYPFLRKNYDRVDKQGVILLFSSVFTIYLFVLLSLIYSFAPDETLKFVEYRLTFLLVPLLFFAGFRVSRKELELLMGGLVAGTLIHLLYMAGLAVFGVCTGVLSADNLTYSPVKTLDPIFAAHRTYLSFYALFSLVIIVCSRSFRYPLWFRIIASWFILTSIFSYESRAIIGIMLVVAFVLPFLLARGKALFRYMAVGYGVLLLSFVVPYFCGGYDNILGRMEETTYELTPGAVAGEQQTQGLGYDSRASRWKVAIDLIEERPLTGYGSGAEKEVLTKAYLENDMTWSAVQSLDVHNQFLSLGLENGIFAALFFVYLLLFLFYRGIRHRDVITILFVVICGAMCLFENILNVNWIIPLFAFLSTAFLFQPIEEKRTPIF